MVPPGWPNPALLVTLSGIAEILGGVGLLSGRFSRPAAFGLIILLFAVFPANVYAAQERLMIGTLQHPTLLARLIMQVVLIALLWVSIAPKRE